MWAGSSNHIIHKCNKTSESNQNAADIDDDIYEEQQKRKKKCQKTCI